MGTVIQEKQQGNEDRHPRWERLRTPLFVPGGALDALNPVAQNRLKAEAATLAEVFQRSSSNVEGRNGYLSLRNHPLRRLDHPRKRACFTATEWTVLAPFIPAATCGGRPRPPARREVVHAIFDVLRSGVPRADAPERLSAPPDRLPCLLDWAPGRRLGAEARHAAW
jgi:hypothetical protein